MDIPRNPDDLSFHREPATTDDCPVDDILMNEATDERTAGDSV